MELFRSIVFSKLTFDKGEASRPRSLDSEISKICIRDSAGFQGKPEIRNHSIIEEKLW